MKRAYAKSQYAKPCERYCLAVYPDEAESIFESAEKHYFEFMRDMPDLKIRRFRHTAASFPAIGRSGDRPSFL